MVALSEKYRSAKRHQGIGTAARLQVWQISTAPAGSRRVLATNAATLSPAEKLRWADQLVLSFDAAASAPSVSPAEAQITAEARAVQEALAAIGAGQLDRGLDSIRVLARASLFSHWRLFIKGLVAFHRGESEKAERAFAELPPESVLAKASEPYRLLLDPVPLVNRTLTEPVLEAASCMAGHPGWGRLLLRSQAEWLSQGYVRAYQVLRDGAPAFPANGFDLPGVLADFFFKVIFTLDEDARDEGEEHFLEIEVHDHAKNAVEMMLIRRTFCLLNQSQLDPVTLKSKWEGFLAGLRGVHGENRQRDSLGYGWPRGGTRTNPAAPALQLRQQTARAFGERGD